MTYEEIEQLKTDHEYLERKMAKNNDWKKLAKAALKRKKKIEMEMKKQAMN